MVNPKVVVKGSPEHYVDGVFLPPVEVIERRAKDTRWLIRNKFSGILITKIMDYDWVAMDVIRRMANSYGLEKTKRKLNTMLEEEMENGFG